MTKKSTQLFRHCGEGELVGGVHTLVGGVVQVYHELQVLEEEEKGRKVVQEIERESQVEEKRSHGHDYGDDMKGLKRLEPRCVCGRREAENKRDETMRTDVARSQWKSVEVVSGVRIVQCHAIIDVVIDVRVMQCHHAIDNSGFSTLCQNSHLVIKLYQFIITFPWSHFVHTFAPRKHVT